MSGFEIKGMTEFQDNIDRLIVTAFPKQQEKFLKKEANKLLKEMRKTARSRVGKVTGNYLKGFKKGRKVYKWPDNSLNLRVYNKAPHAHLIENGFRLTSWKGRFIRFIPGKHVIADSSKAFEEQFAKDVEDEMIDYIVKELEK